MTHDVGETVEFEHVLVIEDGMLIESGNPLELRQNPKSRYSELLMSERALRKDLWRSSTWRRMTFEAGRIRDTAEDDVRGRRDPG